MRLMVGTSFCTAHGLGCSDLQPFCVESAFANIDCLTLRPCFLRHWPTAEL